jgi:hypothetical protein
MCLQPVIHLSDRPASCNVSGSFAQGSHPGCLNFALLVDAVGGIGDSCSLPAVRFANGVVMTHAGLASAVTPCMTDIMHGNAGWQD